MIEKEVIQGLAVGEDFSAISTGASITTGALEITDRMVISTGSLSIEVTVVDTALSEVRRIAEELEGFVERLSSSGGPERQAGSVTVRVPQNEFLNAIELISVLGEVQSQSLGSDDVSEQFIDLDARLKSALREEESLLALLARTESVSDVLTVERELSRVRSDIERLQGQLNFLERRVELATISVSLFMPFQATDPPAAALDVEVSNVEESVAEVKRIVEQREGELDRVVISVRNGRDRAEITLRVFADDFEETLAAVEREGKVTGKEVQEGSGTGTSDTDRTGEPDARISLSFVTGEGANWGLITAIVAPIGGVLLVVLLGALLAGTYRAGRRRGQGA